MKKSKTIILALDLGRKTGWAIRKPSGEIISGSDCFRPSYFQSQGMMFLNFKRWLVELNRSCNEIDYIYFEAVRRHLGTDAAHIYGGFLAHLTAFAESRNIEYKGVGVTTIKKHITGKGNTSKQQVIEAVRSKGFDPVDDNEADALALLDFAITIDKPGAEE